MPGRRSELGVPRRLAVEVGVDVDEARRHEQPVGVDGAGGVGDGAGFHDGGDEAVVDQDVGLAGWGSGPVDDGATGDEEVIGHARQHVRG